MNFDDLVDESAKPAAAPQQAQPSMPNVPAEAPHLGQEPATPQLNDFDSLESDEEKYGTTGQQIKTALEGAAKSATFGASTGIETALGVKPEDIEARERTNPVSHAVGELGGLAASTAVLPGAGAAGAIAKAGELASAAAGLGEATQLARIGSKAVQMAAENMAFQSGDEIHKMLLDPSKAGDVAANAVFDLGTAGLIGGAGGGLLGGASELWKAGTSTKLASTLKAVSDRMGGIEGIDPLDEAIHASGITLTPEQRALVASDVGLRELGQELAQTATSTGTKVRAAKEDFFSKAQEQMASALGKNPEQIASLSQMSEHEAGTDIKKSLTNSIKESIDPITEQYEGIKSRFKNVDLSGEEKQNLMDSVLGMANQEGYDLSPSSTQYKLVQNVVNEIPNLKTAEDVRKYVSALPHDNFELRRTAGKLSSLFREAGDNAIERVVGAESPELLAEHAEARAAYKNAMTTIDELNDRLHVGKYHGPESFVKALNEMNPEDIVKRLSNKKDAGLLTHLSENFPEVADSIRSFQLDKILKTAADKAMPGQLLNIKSLNSQLEALSPELKSFLISPEGQIKLTAVNQMVDRMPKALGPDTARLIDSMGHALPGSIGTIMSLASGHGAVGSLLSGIGAMVGKNIVREGMDASKLGFLKFMTSSKHVDAEAYKQMVDFIASAQKGNDLLKSSAKNLFRAGSEVLSSSNMPSQSDRLKLEKQIASLEKNPNQMMEGKLAHYMPDEHGQVAAKVGNIAQLLKAAKPSESKGAILDSKPVISKAQEAEYNNTLNIAQQPLVILNKIKTGTITPKDIQIAQAMHPKALEQMQSAVMDQLIDMQAKGKPVPYSLRMGLSLLLNQPVDSTFSPQSILAAQPKPMGTQNQQAQSGTPQKNPSASSMKELTKLPQNHETTLQTSSKRNQNNK